MANSRKSRTNNARSQDLSERVRAQLVALVPRGARLVVALSGGIDSMVLLDCLQRISRRSRLRLGAVHVNHQLSPNAGKWQEFCRRQCRSRRIPYTAVKVVVPKGENVEAAARSARYSVLGAQQADYVVLAQHQDDQVETLLLQLLRGAGVKGLAAMPVLRRAEGGGRRAEGKRKKAREPVISSLIPHPSSLQILRPLLDISRAEILAYARKRALEWVEDESNLNLDIRRNYLRREVLPLIARRFPSYRTTIARSARNLAESAELLDALAVQDGGGSLRADTLEIAALCSLSDARARNLLRFFLARQGIVMPSAERLEEALRQVLMARQDARIAVALGTATLRRYMGRLYLVEEQLPVPRAFAKPWRGERELAVPELGGILHMTPARGTGISIARLGKRPVALRVRQGGERLQPASGRPRRTLKNLLQESRVPPWQRDRLPLLFCGNRLVWVPGIGVSCDFQARSGVPSVEPQWLWSPWGT